MKDFLFSFFYSPTLEMEPKIGGRVYLVKNSLRAAGRHAAGQSDGWPCSRMQRYHDGSDAYP